VGWAGEEGGGVLVSQRYSLFYIVEDLANIRIVKDLCFRLLPSFIIAFNGIVDLYSTQYTGVILNILFRENFKGTVQPGLRIRYVYPGSRIQQKKRREKIKD
jgi:hypothetical protein